MIRITSTRNPRIRVALELASARGRQRHGAFAVEGAREISRALAAGLQPVEAFWLTEEALSPAAAAVLAQLRDQPGLAGYQVSAAVFDRLVVRQGSDGVYAIFTRPPRVGLAELRLPAAPLLLAVQGVEKPGNLGALLRVVDGAGGHGLVVLDGTVEEVNPNVIRASLGTVFAVPVAAATSAEFRAWCDERAIRVYAAALADSARPYTEPAYAGATAILLGSEATGLTPYWLTAADALVQIPMHGIADSLNVATAGAVLLYEAVRQRWVGISPVLRARPDHDDEPT